MSQNVAAFLDLVNCPVGELSRFTKEDEIDKRLIDSGLVSLDELILSLKFVRQRIRFLLFQVSIQDSEADIITKRGEAARERRKEVGEMFLRDLEGLTGGQSTVTVPPHISSHLANSAHRAAKTFLEWFHTPQEKREAVKRCMSPLCGRFFKPTKAFDNFCSAKCEGKGNWGVGVRSFLDS